MNITYKGQYRKTPRPKWLREQWSDNVAKMRAGISCKTPYYISAAEAKREIEYSPKIAELMGL